MLAPRITVNALGRAHSRLAVFGLALACSATHPTSGNQNISASKVARTTGGRLVVSATNPVAMMFIARSRASYHALVDAAEFCRS